MSRTDFIQLAYQHALKSDHIFPEYAACEAALESGFGTSLLAKTAFNLFGTKQHQHPEFGTVSIPTKEFIDDKWIVVNAEWVKYPSIEECFNDRMATLKRLAPCYPHYAAALSSPDGETFVNEVSKTWSTDPLRATKVLDIHAQYFMGEPTSPNQPHSPVPTDPHS